MDVNWGSKLGKPGDAVAKEVTVYGIVPIRFVAVLRVDGWCVYGFPKYPSKEYEYLYGSPISFEKVLSNGDKLYKNYAIELFPEYASLPYAY